MICLIGSGRLRPTAYYGLPASQVVEVGLEV